MTALNIKSVTATAPDGRVVFDQFDLRVRPEEMVYVQGGSKAGKTILCSLMTGLLAPIAGTVEWFGKAASPDFVVCSYIPQTLGLLDDLTVLGNITLPLDLARRSEPQDGIDEVLERLGIAHLSRRPASKVSVGERQRTAIARAVVCRTPILIADEPTAHQDGRNATNIFELFRDMVASGSAVVVTGQEPPRMSTDQLIVLE
jgi:putative ABC transport system ATP-binding protein